MACLGEGEKFGGEILKIIQSIIAVLVLGSLTTACSKSQQIQVAPQSQEETGVIVQGEAQEVQALLSQSSEYRVLSSTHGLYEVKGLSLNEVKAIAPKVVAEQNRYYDKIVSSKRKNEAIESFYTKLAKDEPSEPGPSAQQLPPALEGCDMNITETPEAVIGLTTDVLTQSLTMNLSEAPGFTAEDSVPHPAHKSELEFRWDVLAPGLSSIESSKRTGATFTFTPDSVGMYSIVLVAKDDRNACGVFVGRFLVTHNPDVQFAAIDEERPSIDLVHFKHLKKVDAEKAWTKATGQGVKIAVLDTGLEYNHLAIKFNLAINEKEKSGAADADDDSNNFKDDVIGWDFVNGDNKPFDDEGHGSHVSGLAASHLIGTAKNAQLLPVKVLNAAGGGDVASIIAGIYYAADNGAQVINASLGSQIEEFKTLIDAIKYANDKNVVFIAAAGNESLDLSKAGVDVWPAELDSENIITVGATGFDNALTSYSNFGELEVDVAAPGGDQFEPIYSLATMNTHDAQFVASGGTSMASPIVAGIAALLLEKNPNLTPVQIKEVLMTSGQDVEALSGKVGSGKLLNASDAIDNLLPQAI